MLGLEEFVLSLSISTVKWYPHNVSPGECDEKKTNVIFKQRDFMHEYMKRWFFCYNKFIASNSTDGQLVGNVLLVMINGWQVWIIIKLNCT